jgi:hypothetical protein
MKSKTIVIACVATLAILAVAFLGSGSLLGSSLGVFGQKAIDGVVGLIAYPNRSGSGEEEESEPAHAARVQAAKARGDVGGPVEGAAPGGLAVVNAATDAAKAADGGSVGVAVESGVAGPEISAVAAGTESAVEPAATGTGDTSPPAGTETTDATATAAGEGDPPVAEVAMTLGSEPDRSGARSTWEGEGWGESSMATPGEGTPLDADEDYWEEADPFQFEDETVVRELGPGYSAYDGRDPFLALVTTQKQDVATSEVVDPDGLRFVGIIWGPNGICAVVEDRQRRGVVLREGDRVLYGRVASITREAVIIDQVIHGEFKRITLHLEPLGKEGN